MPRTRLFSPAAPDQAAARDFSHLMAKFVKEIGPWPKRQPLIAGGGGRHSGAWGHRFRHT